jgi:exodeoxyribonuclease VII small subunit
VSSKTKSPTFEVSLHELEKIITELEKGDQPLEDQFKAFERGVALSRDCLQKLDEVEKKVQILVQDSAGNLRSEDFSE